MAKLSDARIEELRTDKEKRLKAETTVIKIKHEKHGNAHCSESQFEEMADLGWERVEADDAAGKKAGRKAKAD